MAGTGDNGGTADGSGADLGTPPSVGTAPADGGTVDAPDLGPPPIVDNYPYVVDYSSRPPSAVTMPPKLGAYIDPEFGTKIIRATDASDGTRCMNAYSYWPAFNRDSTRLLIECDSVGRLYRFDPSSDTLVYDGPLVTAGGPSQLQFDGAFWSYSEPSVVYALAGTSLWRIDTAQTGAGRYTKLHDFAGLFSYSFGAYQLGKADDDNTFTFSSRDGSGLGIDVAVYKLDSNQTFIFPRPAGFNVDESQMSKDGQRVVIPSRDGRWAIWTWATNTVDLIPWTATARPGGHYDGGRTQLVNADNWNTGFQVRDWTGPGLQTPRDFFRAFGSDGATLDWGVPNHVSMRSDDESFVIFSTYGSTSGWQPFMKEIVQVRLDGSGFVRLGHTRGTVDGDYAAEPRAVVDRLGRYVVYTSDLGNPSRLDVMILKIPPKFAGKLP